MPIFFQGIKSLSETPFRLYFFGRLNDVLLRNISGLLLKRSSYDLLQHRYVYRLGNMGIHGLLSQHKDAGFSSAPKEKLYIRQDESADRQTVKAQIADKNSLYNEVKRLIEIRKSHPALLSRGDIEFVFAEKNAYPLAYLRSETEERILVIINPAGRETEFDCKYTPKEKLYSIGGDIAVGGEKITVPPQFAGYYII